MPHSIAYKRLSRTDGHRKALLRNLATSLFKHEKIETTSAKAKEITRVAERLITTAMAGDLAARRQLAQFITEPAVVKKLVEQIAPALKGRPAATRASRRRACVPVTPRSFRRSSSSSND